MKKILLLFLVVLFVGINSVFAEESFEEVVVCPMGIPSLIIQFETNGGTKLDDMHNNIDYPIPEGSSFWPTPTKSGADFEGWYYDETLTQKLDVETIEDFRFEKQKDKNDCTVPVRKTLYAKWNTISNNESNSSDISNSSTEDNSSKNPDTGAFVSAGVISGLLVIGIILYSVFKKYTRFKKI